MEDLRVRKLREKLGISVKDQQDFGRYGNGSEPAEENLRLCGGRR